MEMYDYSKDPEFPPESIYPLDWDFDTSPQTWRLYSRAKREQWDEDQIDWAKLEEIASGLERKQRLGVAYWWCVLATFDNAAPVFGYAMVKSHERHIPTAYRSFISTITFDENRHCMVCGRASQCMFKGFPRGFKPQDELERKAARNVLWTWYNGARYWNAYKEAYNKYTFDVLLTSFMMGEAAATTIFSEMGDGAKIPQFKQVFRQISLDETRHYAFTHVLLQDNLPKMDESRKMMVTKQIRAGFIFLSLIMYRPPKDFWKLPHDYEEVHFKMEDLARDAGLGVPSLEEKEKAWREAVLRVGAAVSKYGVKFPEIPELGISGEEVEGVSEEDVIPVF
ncbi:aminobenzoate oxygenase [Candidatus Marsarchaeota G2 archaeon OSP_D]|jgi:hypothetical protein|uniref:Aminobenzoate oxygenase n=6 Tax=Candidatus Marsarchaeota group 2 TaxID=2203771 RepID=A0A2R6BBX9_9ARCH|nr:MAG: aminobenzoate oxygenase [Candidatus Marsarchaeota G2 archaeon OSP_D]PSN93118.1 MAG: aminobenzoate oxygenase [Candidatus Marsarchaeota G2 archaeon ECH_B_SAG-C16]PSN94608.1 MAG: aminobenzoate oxygenase [Candidatus Marsarchaeota G2 archaeon ECH_B_2]PSO00167.1 MAG: aminobenzoate oxygenase [Candidatus Marsarchaeota G2 archaeon ECH_B_3]PSO02662.1 MAG: aminobenzoate oxygenase [Candidatus Marsarchaeota G2 archaeon ECH_B_1]PSO06984.1 MAG: aminobenzoate oxygenase [Candidatus Marsarchaeota G2 arc